MQKQPTQRGMKATKSIRNKNVVNKLHKLERGEY